ncbi:biogenesis of lysosome-related organelles complex 1 subunit 2-like [Actinia tenebrosa]|uniref:Biogenesis of lysosome-related organelles complex 1 subunit 2-like n=1 Tax=Actinia tenebrosa TaxID=6105 RepID=A0A6P8I9C3_ACTTE|nr:biogenesis of lysosome-related organelles complex 1 subunit 2-like [Actinia tenebrosa]
MADGGSEVENLPKTSDSKTEKESHESSTKLEESEDTLEVISTDSNSRRRIASESSLNEDASYAELQDTCRETFKKIAEYLNGELTASLDDYALLEKLNKLTTSKYQEMSTMAKTLITTMEELDGKYKSLQPYLDQIDRVEESVASLEQAAYRLDAYSKKLESRFKRLEKR